MEEAPKYRFPGEKELEEIRRSPEWQATHRKDFLDKVSKIDPLSYFAPVE